MSNIPDKPSIADSDLTLINTWGGSNQKPSATEISNGFGGNYVAGTNLGSYYASTTKNWENKYHFEWQNWNATTVDYLAKNTELYEDTGSANAFNLSITSGETPTTYTDGMKVRWFSNFTSTGACSINVNGIGSKNIVSYDGDAILSGQIGSGDYVEATFDTVNNRFVVCNIMYTNEFVKTDGSVAFLAPQVGVTPTASNHLATKGYVDTFFPRNYIDGLTMANASDADHDIQISPGQCSDSTNTTVENLSSYLTKQIDASWTEGNNLGGFPSGLTLAANTTYHVFIISKTDGTIDAGFDTSLTASNLLISASAYTYYRRIGSVITDASKNILAFKQYGDDFYLSTSLQTLSTSSEALTATDLTLTVPNGIVVKAIIFAELFTSASLTASNTFLKINSKNLPNNTFILNANPRAGSSADDVGNNNSSYFELYTDTSKKIQYTYDRGTNAGGSIAVYTHGWTDSRGKE